MHEIYTKSAQQALNYAAEEANAFRHKSIGSAHLLLGLFKEDQGVAHAALAHYLPEYDELREEVELIMGYGNGAQDSAYKDDRAYSPKSRKVLYRAAEEAKRLESSLIGTEHILLAILEETMLATRILDNMAVDKGRLRKDIYRMIGKRPPRHTKNANRQSSMLNGSQQKQSVLASLTKDLTQAARDGKLDQVIGRDFEVRRLLQILSRRTKNNPVLVGEPGVGKTAIAEVIAQKLANGDIPPSLANKRLLSLDVGSLVAGTKYRGEFEDRVKNLVNEIEEDGNALLFIDEIHTIIGAGGAEGAIDASNLLKPALARGTVQIIGATTLDEYQKYIEKDAALERRFAKVQVEEPSLEEAVAILSGLRPAYEKYHNVAITDAALEAAVRLSERYISDRYLPDKAIDIMDEAGASKRLDQPLPEKPSHNPDEVKSLVDQLEAEKLTAVNQGNFDQAAELHKQQFDLVQDLQAKIMAAKPKDQEVDQDRPLVSEDDMAQVVSMWTKIPVQQMQASETSQLQHLESDLHQRVKGQEEAVEAVSRAIKRARSGMKNPNRPIGSFMFLGPTGVGKTELAKTLAVNLFGSEKHLIRIDMSEYMEKYASSRLVGSAPGYVGYEEGGQLTEKVRQHPYSVILFDEIEKAHPDVFNMMLQIFDDGYITDSKGRRVDFRNTILIMTSNLGATALRDEKSVGFGAQNPVSNYEAMSKRIREEVKRTFRPEFINRIDEIIVFHSLAQEQIEEIVTKFTDDLAARLSEQEISLKVTAGGRRHIAKVGFKPEYGARPLRRVIQSQIEDPLSDMLIAGQVGAGDEVTVGVNKEKIYIKVKHPNGSEFKENISIDQEALTSI
ncbi:ATP-dependent Clp protease ATP-binding subunit [Aerococcus kribbianus]|uniref:ATP-dependent Clp protease ATP-binding subunit n=1 Tax=Aerococcus kribbianus TaxID=2999064 RepID=A0A9X3JF75_9LACT|nr:MULTISPECIES: ATP-dependent Clp protease ATP-binding subunit [unclassified Aerococcus]MCZ0717935.1 ATP-dependent Clp protease ATP-binding subunit [Aerococcus sp. YH-aer221]MCZ0726222.1 ATP-dependent Clp protease ATP-binding subunit [Aerococcus sp. YH-aer222]